MKEQRTISQNSALHVFFRHLAEELNNAGLDMKKVLKPHVDIPWTQDTVKEMLWKPIQEAQLSKKSTTELEKKEVDEIYGTLNRHLGGKFGVHVEFPSEETLNPPQ